MKNYGLIKYLNADITNFTSVKGIKRRQKIASLLKKLLLIATKEKIVVENYPELEKNEPSVQADVLVRREEDRRYDLKRYLRETLVLSPK